MKTMISTISQKNMQTAEIEIAYLEAGSDDGQPIVLFHGFPDCACSYSEVMIALANLGYKTFAPFLRGFAPTRFLDEDTSRSGDIAALGQDAIDFFDSLALKNAIIVGQDWGSAIAEILTFSRPDKVARLVKLNWHGIYALAESMKRQGFNYEQMRNSWYIWMLNTQLGEPITTYDSIGFSLALWKQWTPSWDKGQDKLFEEAKSSFQSPDFGKIVLSAYRSGMNPANSNTAHNQLRAELAKLPAIETDTIILSGTNDPVESGPLTEEAIKKYFIGKFEHREIVGAGHFIHHQNPNEVIDAITGK
jgi:pimeloyl-ACP methyl ester carboxylesterase